MKSEKNIELAFRRWCEGRGYRCLKLALINARGFPDRTVIGPNGLIAFVELKRRGGRIARLQKHWINTLRELGFRAGIAESLDEAVAIVRGEI